MTIAPATTLPTGGLTINQGTSQLALRRIRLANIGTVTLAGGSVNLDGFNQTLTALRSAQVAGTTSTIFNPSNAPFATISIEGMSTISIS